MKIEDIFKKGCKERAKRLERAKENMHKSLAEKAKNPPKYYGRDERISIEKYSGSVYLNSKGSVLM